jgi:signal transduction histidine kinase
MSAKLFQTLAFKLFISYLAVLLVGMVTLALAVEIVIPTAFERHMSAMQGMMGMMGRMDIFSRFRSGVNEAMAVAGFAAGLTALVASITISRRVVAPVHAITRASLRIAEGHFEERVVTPQAGLAHNEELAQLAQAFNQMAERLEHVEQMRLQLLADVSHELRTPLTAIKGSMEALVDGVLPADAQTFKQIEQEADRLQRLVNDLQELSRVESGAYDLHLEPLSIAELVQAATQRMEQPFKLKDISLEVNLPPGLEDIPGDRDRLMQVMINLLDNACQYTPPGGQVSIEVKRQGHEVLVAVHDSGMGIPPEHLPNVFTRFYRVDKSRSRQAGGGSGIGLTIARHLVEAHGGRLWAESQGVGKGSTFAFTLPL